MERRSLTTSGESRNGFHFEYKLGKSFGSVKILPLTINTRVHRRILLPEGTVDLATRIEVEEKWFPKEPGTMQVRVSSTTH
jgi:CTP-dependent riboflavin kinase